MDWSLLGRWEWALIELIVLGLAIAELIAIRRVQRRDRETRRRADSGNRRA